MYIKIYAVLLANAFIFSKSWGSVNRSVKNEEISKMIRENLSNKSVVAELQYTFCSIKTDEIVAKAQSTASRILTGICTSEDMAKAFINIEKVFLERLDEIQRNLTVLIQSKLMQPVPPKKNHGYSKMSAIRTVKELLDKNLFKDIS